MTTKAGRVSGRKIMRDREDPGLTIPLQNLQDVLESLPLVYWFPEEIDRYFGELIEMVWTEGTTWH